MVFCEKLKLNFILFFIFQGLFDIIRKENNCRVMSPALYIGEDIMKKILAACLMLLSLTGCAFFPGNPKDPAPAQTIPTEEPIYEVTEPATEPRVQAPPEGYWICSGIRVNDEELTAEAIEERYHMPVEDILSVRFYGSTGYASCALMGEGGLFPFEETDYGWCIEIGGNRIPVMLRSDGVMEIGFMGSEESGDVSIACLDNSSVPTTAYSRIAEANFAPNLTMAETYAMGNFMNQGLYLVENSMLYGISFDRDTDPILVKIPILKDRILGDLVALDRGIVTYLCTDGESLFYIRDGKSIRRLPLDATAASTPSILYQGKCDYLQFHDGMLYFTDKNGAFCTMSPKGGKVEKAAEINAAMPYFLCDNWVIFRDRNAGNRLCMTYLPTGKIIPLTEEIAYTPIARGHELFYLLDGEDGGCYMNRLDLNTMRKDRSDKSMAPEYLFTGWQELTSTNGAVVALDNWKELTDDAWREGYSKLYRYSDGHYQIYHVYGEDALITTAALTITGKDGLVLEFRCG